MSDAKYDEYDKIIPVPFLTRIIRKLKETPCDEDLEYMKKTDVKEMKIFFDKLCEGASDREVYDAVLAHIHDLQRKKREAEEAERARLEAIRKAEEARLAAEKAKAEAERKAAQAAKEAEERRKREEEEAKKLAAEEAERLRKEREEAERKAKEEAERAAAEAKAAAEAAEREAARMKAEAEEAARLAAEKREAELAARCPGKCTQCKQWIEDKSYLTNEDVLLHHACLEEYQKNHCPTCTQCKKPLTGDYVTMKSAVSGEEGLLHEDCVLDWKKATRPNCKQCGEQILDGPMLMSGADYYHGPCAEKAREAATR